MRNATLHSVLEAFTADAAVRLAAEAQSGAEIDFELVAEPGGSSPLYCYRPLTGRFIGERAGLLSALTSYAPAVRALASQDGLGDYLRRRGERQAPTDPRERADAALASFLARVFAERSRFGFERERFEQAYAELELALYQDKRTTTVIAPVLGLALDHEIRELALDDGLALVRGDCVPEAPAEALWRRGSRADVLASLTVTEDRSARSPMVGRPGALSPPAHCSAAVRARWLCARSAGLGRARTAAPGTPWPSAAADGRGRSRSSPPATRMSCGPFTT